MFSIWHLDRSIQAFQSYGNIVHVTFLLIFQSKIHQSKGHFVCCIMTAVNYVKVAQTLLTMYSTKLTPHVYINGQNMNGNAGNEETSKTVRGSYRAGCAN